MLRKIAAVIVVLVLAVSFGACKKKEEKPQMPAGHPGMEGSMPPNMQEMPKVDRKIIVPNDVKAKWKAVKLNIEDKTAKSAKEYVVAIGSDVAIPNTKMKVKVLTFLPDFKMGDQEITSASDKPNNPAAQVVIEETGKPEWKGWLYSLHPAIHPFQHEKIAITLVGGVAK